MAAHNSDRHLATGPGGLWCYHGAGAVAWRNTRRCGGDRGRLAAPGGSAARRRVLQGRARAASHHERGQRACGGLLLLRRRGHAVRQPEQRQRHWHTAQSGMAPMPRRPTVMSNRRDSWMADRACRVEQPGPSALADALAPLANGSRPRPECLPSALFNLFRPLALSPITTSPAHPPHSRWSGRPLGNPTTLSASASCARFPLILSSPLSTLHSVAPGPLPWRSRSSTASRCPRYPLAFDLASVPYRFYS